MSYQVLARKWRPQVFEDVVGQGHITRTLQNAITSGRLAHAFLFSGPRGVGKTTTARILAKALNCEQGPTPTPCGKCDSCLETTAGTSVDVIEIDGASNRGIEHIRELREAVKYAPVGGKNKVYVIDEVHMLTNEAFNALLKTLEEPPPHVIFIFATTEPQKIPATIHSRCQRYGFKRVAAPRDHRPSPYDRRRRRHHHNRPRARHDRAGSGRQHARFAEPSRPGRVVQRNGDQGRGPPGDARVRCPGEAFTVHRRPSCPRRRRPAEVDRRPAGAGAGHAAVPVRRRRASAEPHGCQDRG